ncbi:MAG: Vms1/Ankzf1 family peptidyl-tRNA hydrolase [Caldilineaceae bacterium]
MLTDLDVRQALEFECEDHPVLSVYLNVDPRDRTAEQYRLALRNLLAQVEAQAPDDVRQVRNYIETGYNWRGRGLIMFSCKGEGFWWAKGVSAPVVDKVFVSIRPYVYQLAALLDAYARLGVIHVDQVGARFYLFHLGNLEAAEGHLGEEVHVHRAGGWASARYQRHEMETARQNLSAAAEFAESFYRNTGTRRLILAGTEKNVAKFESLLSHRLRNLVIGTIPADTNAGAQELQGPASDLAHQAAADAGRDLADQVITLARSKDSNGVLGLAETLYAVQSGRAQHVVVLNGYSQPALRFKESKYVVLDEAAAAATGSEEPIEQLPDAVDSVLRRALLYGIDVTVVDEHPALSEAGKIGALARY